MTDCSYIREVLCSGVVEEVTPAKAMTWLGVNFEKNRPINPRTVDAYADDMRRGEFIRLAPIVFDVDGRLIDGQHTLSAIVKYGKGIPLFVLRDVPTGWVRFIDIQKVRTLSHQLHMLHDMPMAQGMAAIAIPLANWDRGCRSSLGSTGAASPPLTKPFLEEFVVANYEDLLPAARKGQVAYRALKGMGKSWYGLAHVLFSRSNRDLADEFFDRLVSGAGLVDGSPILIARNRILASAASKTKETPASLLTVLIRSWNAFTEGRELRRVYGLEPGDKIPDVK